MTIDPRKPVFDAVKAQLPAVWADDGNILAMDNLLDAFGFPRAGGEEEWLALAAPLAREFEGYSGKAYPDPGTGGKPWTIGFGSTTDENGQPIKPGTVWTKEQAEARFRADLAKFGEGVRRAIAGKPTTPAQMAAMVSLAYNIGLTAFARSTVLSRHRAGDYPGAADAFAMWKKANGRVLPGLVKRRAAEAALYRGDAA